MTATKTDDQFCFSFSIANKINTISSRLLILNLFNIKFIRLFSYQLQSKKVNYLNWKIYSLYCHSIINDSKWHVKRKLLNYYLVTFLYDVLVHRHWIIATSFSFHNLLWRIVSENKINLLLSLSKLRKKTKKKHKVLFSIDTMININFYVKFDLFTIKN